MNNDLFKILSDSNKNIDNKKLIEYLAGRLSAKENHDVEKLMADSNFINDAVEGLQEVKNDKDIEALVEHLNNDLHRKLEQKKIRKEKRKLKEYFWIYFAIILIVSLLIITWFIFQRLHTS